MHSVGLWKIQQARFSICCSLRFAQQHCDSNDWEWILTPIPSSLERPREIRLIDTSLSERYRLITVVCSVCLQLTHLRLLQPASQPFRFLGHIRIQCCASISTISSLKSELNCIASLCHPSACSFTTQQSRISAVLICRNVTTKSAHRSQLVCGLACRHNQSCMPPAGGEMNRPLHPASASFWQLHAQC